MREPFQPTQPDLNDTSVRHGFQENISHVLFPISQHPL